MVRLSKNQRSKASLLPIPLHLCLLAAAADSYVFVARNETIPGCSADCLATDVVSKWYWQKQVVTATLTAATIVLVVDERTNTTKTETIFNDLPSGVSIPPTNAKGTQTTTIEVETKKGQKSVVTLAYPTDFVGYPLSYKWIGTLPTINAMGAPVCSTAKGGQWIDYSAYETPVQQPTTPVDPADPTGFIYSLMGFACANPAEASINPNDAAPVLCSSESICGVSALQTVQLLTATSVRKLTSPPEITPPPAEITPTPAQPLPQQDPAPQDPAPQNPAPQNPAPQNPEQNPAPQSPTPQNPVPPPGPNTVPTPQPPTGASNQQQPPAVPPAPAPIVVGTQSFVANPESNFVIGSQTLTPGGQIIAGSNTVSLAQGGTAAVVNGTTQALRPTVAPIASPVIAINGQTITANTAGQFAVGTNTLAIGGPAITLGTGTVVTTVSLNTNTQGHTVVVVNGASSTLLSGTRDAVGDAVASGIDIEQSTGDAGRIRAWPFGPFLASWLWAFI